MRARHARLAIAAGLAAAALLWIGARLLVVKPEPRESDVAPAPAAPPRSTEAASDALPVLTVHEPPASSYPAEPLAGPEVAEPEPDPSAAGTVIGRLVDEASGLPVAGVAVRLRGWNLSRRSRPSGPDGRFAVGWVAGGSFEASLVPERFRIARARQRIWVETGVPTDVGDLPVIAGGTLEGLVVGPGRRPLCGASVRVARSRDGQFIWDDASATAATTGEDGRYRIPGVEPAASLIVVATHADFAPARADRVIVAPGETSEVALIELAPGSTIAGRVASKDGNPIAGATVRAVESGSDALAKLAGTKETTCDASGRYELAHRLPGRKTLTASAKGIAPATQHDVEIPGEAGMLGGDFYFALESGNVLGGRVVDAQRRAIAGATVSAFSAGDQARGGSTATTGTSSDGTFLIENVPAGVFTVDANAGGFRQARVGNVAAGTIDLEIVLDRGASLGGRVLDARTGDPVAHAFVRAQSRMTVSDPGGAFRFDGLKPGEQALLVKAAGYRKTTAGPFAVGALQGAEEIVIPLDRGASISGIVLRASDRLPIADALIQEAPDASRPADLHEEVGAEEASPWERGDPMVSRARSARDGRFVLRGLATGTHRIQVLHRDHLLRILDAVDLVPGDERDVGEVLLEEGGGIHGRVLASDGRPAPGVTITASREKPWIRRSALTDGTGAYEIRGLPAGTYTVGNQRDEPVAEHEQERRTVLVREGKMTTVDFVPRAGGCRLHGVVRDGHRPLSFARVMLSRSSVEGGERRSVRADDGGRYELPGISPGPCVLEVQSGRHTFAVETEVPLADEHRLDIAPPSGGISGGVLDASTGSPIGGVSVWPLTADGVGCGEVQSDENGHFELRWLSAGTYRLRTSSILTTRGHYAGGDVGEVVVLDGRITRADVHVRRGGWVSGYARNLPGVPLEAIDGRLVREGPDGASERHYFFGRGQFMTPPVPPGTYTSEIAAPGYASPGRTGVRIEAGSERREELVLRRGGTLRVIVLDAAGRVLRDAIVEVTDSSGATPLTFDESDEVLDFRRRGSPRQLAPGVYTVRARTAEGREASASVIVEEGREAVVRLTIR
jgi:hypothetical protein